MSLKSLKACGDLADAALIVFEARNRLRGALESFRAKHKVTEGADAAAVALAFPAAERGQPDAICALLCSLEAALAALDPIADTLPANDLDGGI